MAILRFRQPKIDQSSIKCTSMGFESFEPPKIDQKLVKKWRRLDSCCWIIGYLCTTWWLILFFYHCLPVTLFHQAPELPGVRLKREGLKAHHPLVLVPGIFTGGLELWEGRPCADGMFRKRLWGSSFTETFKRPLCWSEHLSLHNETGLDPPGIRVRAVTELLGDSVWSVLIKNLAKIGYERKNLHLAAYDWRLSFQNTEIRDHALSRLKHKIEQIYITNGYKKVVVLPHSMGAIYFLHFLKWVENPPPMGGGGSPGWCAKHIKAIMNISPPLQGVPKAVSNTNRLSAEGKDVAYIRAIAAEVLDSEILRLQTLEHVVRVTSTWDSIVSLMPKGGETIWGNMDCSRSDNNNVTKSDVKSGFRVKDQIQCGRTISYGKDSKELSHTSASQSFNFSCGEALTEHDKLSRERESIQKIDANKAYTTTTRTLLDDLLGFVPPKSMQQAEAHFSHGIADNLDDPGYTHYKYWSNPLEMKLPDVPDMEIYCLYGVGIPTERSHVYKLSANNRCLNVPAVLSAGFMCAKGWRGPTRFNPSGIATYIREYMHKPPAPSLLEGGGIGSGAHVDLIEDILRIAAGATGKQIGGDRIFSDILTMSERVNLQL